MKNTLPYITFVIQDSEGGVSSMNHQIIENADFHRYFNVHIILWRLKEKGVKSFRDRFAKANDISRFEYSRYDNYHHVLGRLNILLNKYPGHLVTNDGIEMESIRRFGTRSVVFSIIHDFYNLKLALENMDLTDYFLCHTDVFTKALSSSIQLRERVFFLLHGVKIFSPGNITSSAGKKLRIVSISRLAESKGVLLLSAIDDRLAANGIGVEWIIIGSGPVESELHRQWQGKTNISFYKPDTQEEVYQLASTGDIFISPSEFEGYGIALLEAMSCGLVPVISRLPVGVYSNLPGTVGRSVAPGDIEGFSNAISLLANDRGLLDSMAAQAKRLVAEKYDISSTADAFLQVFVAHTRKVADEKGNKRRQVPLGILDRGFLPNTLTRMIKKIVQGA